MQEIMDGKPYIRTLRDVDSSKPVFWIPDDDFVGKALLPCFKNCDTAYVMAAFFTGASLAEIAPGLASYLVNTSNPLKLLISPVLSESDQKSLANGDLDEIAERALDYAMNDECALSNLLSQHTKECLAYLLNHERLQIKVVLMRKGSFHPKSWIFSNGNDTVVLSGSANMTGQALTDNVEQIRFDASWESAGQKTVCDDNMDKFLEYWEDNKRDIAEIITLKDAAARKVLKGYSGTHLPTYSDYLEARDKEEAVDYGIKESTFSIPSWLNWQSGSFSHQKNAIDAWEENGEQGVLAVATGGGKTLTSLIAAQRLSKKMQYSGQGLFICVAVPYTPLLSQWAEEMKSFGLNPYIGNSKNGSTVEHIGNIRQLLNKTRVRSDINSAVITHKLLANSEFKRILTNYRDNVLLIGDEVHNLGSEGFMKDNPNIRYKMGLSATPERFDQEETDSLIEYFGGVVSIFSLEQAISSGCLVPYTYDFSVVRLTENEIDEYLSLSQKIGNAQSVESVDKEMSNRVAILCAQRHGIVEQAGNKLKELERLMDWIGTSDLKHTLIYCSSKGPRPDLADERQINLVNKYLEGKGINYTQITSKETSDGTSTLRLNAFREGRIDVVTSMKILDEGYNIPEIRRAILMASSTSRREWVQRRGRILRKLSNADTSEKRSAELHDIIVLPPDDYKGDPRVATLVMGELARAQEFLDSSRGSAKNLRVNRTLIELKLNWIFADIFSGEEF